MVAPEALSKFYFDGLTGEVGASWMTKANREDEIADYANYLQQVYDLLVPQLSDKVSITLFGFSQGGTTQSRFALLNKPDFDHLVLWGSNFAHDLDYKKSQEYLADKKIFLFIGSDDQFITPELAEKALKFADEQGITYSLINYTGKHEIIRSDLNAFFKQLYAG